MNYKQKLEQFKKLVKEQNEIIENIIEAYIIMRRDEKIKNILLGTLDD